MESLGPVYYLLIAAAFIFLLMGIYIAYLLITTLLTIRKILEKFEKGQEQVKKEFYDLKRNLDRGFWGWISGFIKKRSK